MASQSEVRALDNQIDQDRLSASQAPAALSAPVGGAGDAPNGSRALALGAQLPKVITTSEAMDKAMKGMVEGQENLNKQLPGLQGQVEARRADLSGELNRPMPAAPKLQDIPQFNPKQLDKQELTMFAGIAMALAGLGTRAMRGDTATALNAAGAAMKGFNDGNLQQARLDMEQFKRQMDSVVAGNHKMSEEYRGILENRKLSLSQKEQALRVSAASRDDQIMLQALQQGQLKTVFDLEAHRINATNQAALRAAQISTNFQARTMHEENMRELAKVRAASSEHGRQSGLSSDAIDNAAAYYILNGRMPVGMARVGQSAIEAIQNRAGEMTKKMGMSPEQFAAAGPIAKQKLGALLALEKQRNAIQSFEGMLDLNIDILKDLSKKVERTDSPYANKPILWLQQNAAGDPDVSEYLFQVQTVMTETARILNNPNMAGQLTDSARIELEQVIRGEMNPAQLERVLSRAQSDARNRSKMLDNQSEKVVKEIQNPLGRQASGGAAPNPGGAQPMRQKSKSGRDIISNDNGKTWEYVQ